MAERDRVRGRERGIQRKEREREEEKEYVTKIESLGLCALRVVVGTTLHLRKRDNEKDR